MLWLCLHFPKLPLEIFSRAQALPCAWVITDGKGAQRYIINANDLALTQGVQLGMPLRAACSFIANLYAQQRDIFAEKRALEGLAAWAGQFSSWVSLLPPQTLLLEIKGSLQLFDGVHALLHRVHDSASQLGYHALVGVAPTPMSACLLARSGIATPVLHVQELPSALRALPLTLLALPEKLLQMLHGLGLRELGELLRLPRADLQRRAGNRLLQDLDRLLGRRPDLPPAYTPPETFERSLVLPAETSDEEALLFPMQRLLLELSGFLSARHAGADQLQWQLHHNRRKPSAFYLHMSTPTRDAQHLLKLMRERLTRIKLSYPVEAISLHVHTLHTLLPQTMCLDGSDGTAAEPWPRLLERLRARLGDTAVQAVQCWPDHRPEYAYRITQPAVKSAMLPQVERPLWLLAEPRLLSLRDGMPCMSHPLQLLKGPERIETGWWDTHDVARDYYTARDSNQVCYWVFRERRGEQRWFVHGFFA